MEGLEVYSCATACEYMLGPQLVWRYWVLLFVLDEIMQADFSFLVPCVKSGAK